VRSWSWLTVLVLPALSADTMLEKIGAADPGVSVTGRITYTGPIPRPVPVVEANAVRPLIEVDRRTKGLRDAVVWLEGVQANPGPVPKAAAFMDQQNYFFLPHVLTVRAGQPVEFLNSDSANHGVLAQSFEPKNSFNAVTPPGQSYTHRFHAVRQPVRIGCPIHAGMAAWIVVFEHPWHAVTDREGRFQLPRVPPGKYRLQVRHLDGDLRHEQPLEIKTGVDPRPTIALKRPTDEKSD
jgi:plastocyanin